MTDQQAKLARILQWYQGRGRDALLPILWQVQTQFGTISPEAVREISHTIRVPEADIYGVATFYDLFYTEPTGERIVRICTDPACGIAGADERLASLCQNLGIQPGDTTADGKFTVDHAPCLGMCDHAPAGLLSKRGIGQFAIPNVNVEDMLAGIAKSVFYRSHMDGDPRVLLEGATGNPRSQHLSDYGDYTALHRALFDRTPEAVIQEIEDSKLIGRGGAAFPTGLKWKFTRQADGIPKYVICNADESEPGTFKDRVLMEQRPHLILEGMAIAGYAIGSNKGIIFVRGEYPNSVFHLARAIEFAKIRNFIGDNIMGSEFSFHIEIRIGAGAYICGKRQHSLRRLRANADSHALSHPIPRHMAYSVSQQWSTMWRR